MGVTTKSGETMSDEITRQLHKIIEQENMENHLIEMSSCTEKGDNNIGVLVGIKVTDDRKQLHLISKTEPQNDVIRREFRTNLMFDKEQYLYSEILPLYEQFQNDRGILPCEGFFNYPRCYSSNRGCSIMQDMRHDEYKMYDRFKDMDFDHAKLSVEALGRFHALSFAMKDQQPEVFEKHKDNMRDNHCGTPTHPATYGYFKVALDFAAGTLEDGEQDLKDKMHHLKDNVEDILSNCVNCKDAEPFAVITHGDFWNNNLLYKYQDGKPISICLLDYQLSRYSSPAVDLSQYLFCCSNKQFRDQHYKTLLHAYHKSLSEMLERLGSDADEIFPFSALENQMQPFGVFGLVFASFMLKMILSKGDDSFDAEQCAEMINSDKKFTNNTEFIPDKRTYQLYKSRMSDVIRDAARLGMI